MKIPAIKGFDQDALNKYLKNTGWLMLGRVGSMAIKMFISIQLANFLLPAGNGVLKTSIAYIYLFAALASLGLDSFIVKELHQYPKNRDTILGTSFILKTTAGLLCLPLIYMAWLFFPLSDIPYLFILILSFGGVFQSLTIIDAYFQSEVKSKYIMQVQIVGNLLSAIIKLLLIFYFKAALIYFIYAYVFDILLVSVGYLIVYKNQGLSFFTWVLVLTTVLKT